MTKTKNWISTALVALFVSSTALFAAPAAGSSEPTYLLVLDTPDGIVEKTMTQSEVDAQLTCTINAPETPSCSNGPVTRGLSASHGLLLPIPAGFSTVAGDVPVKKMAFVSSLRSASSERIFRCEVNQTPAPAGTGAVTFACYGGSGTWPAIGAAMTQTAYAFATSQGGSGDTTAYDLFKQSGGAVHIPGLGRVTAQLTY